MSIVSIKQICSNCGISITPIEHDDMCPECRKWHVKYLEYVVMARGIGHSYVGDVCQ